MTHTFAPTACAPNTARSSTPSLADKRRATPSARTWPTLNTMQLAAPGSDDELLAYAQGLLDRVSSHADAFVAGGLPHPTF
jgi:hypothetical protein